MAVNHFESVNRRAMTKVRAYSSNLTNRTGKRTFSLHWYNTQSMDQSFLHSQSSSNQTKETMDTTGENVTAKVESHDDQGEYEGSAPHLPGDDSRAGHDTDDASFEDGDRSSDKRPRLRLAHACDRCRKRKIRCDTEQPCGPCKATQNECTFNAPPRRIAKPRPPLGALGQRSGSTSGFKRPHDEGNGEKTFAQANLEARLAALEAMLGDVPPKVHNMALSSLDARLGGVPLESITGQNGNDIMQNSWFSGNTAPSTLAGYAANKGKQNGNILQLRSDFRGLRKTGGDVNDVTKRLEGMSFFYEDEIGQAKWQGTTSGFPLLDLLTANDTTNSGTSANPQSALEDEFAFLNPEPSPQETIALSRTSTSPSNTLRDPSPSSRSSSPTTALKSKFFPDRTPRPHQTLNPEASWKVITGVIPPDLMDTLVRCYLSTSHLLWPFLHVPSFLADYANPQQWGEPGFTCFIVAVCTLSSRHVDDPRVRANPLDPSTAGKSYFQLFTRLRDLPSADRPTLYSIQAAFLAAIYAFGLGNLSKAFALQAESITLCLDGGLHRSVDGYDHFDAIEKETRKRTFWSIYSWDKQSAALFGRPPIINLRVTDTPEPMIVDDENLTATGIIDSTKTSNSRMEAFVATIRLHVVLEGILDIGSKASSFPGSPFLSKAAAHLSRRYPQIEDLKDEEELVEEWRAMLPKYWQYDADTTNSRDPIRITQAERLHCLEHLVKMLIYRHQFSGFVNTPAATSDEMGRHRELCRKAMQCALTIIADHVHISQRGMMTYYGVHVIHQLAQAGRTLVAVILNCRNVDFRPLIAPSIEGLKSCVGLLRRFSGRYLCGLRSADIIDEFCRICNIPVDSPRVPDGTGRPPPAWLRPVRKRTSPSPVDTTSASQDAFGATSGNQPSLDSRVADLEALFNANMDNYIDLSTLSSPPPPTTADNTFDSFAGTSFGSSFGASSLDNTLQGQWAMSPTDETANPNPWSNGLGNVGNGTGTTPFDYSSVMGMGGMSSDATPANGINGMNGAQGFGGELLAGEGMDSVSDGLQSGGGQGLSAATILSLLEEGTFDYGSVFTDQAPLPMSIDESTDETP